jgi:hypothetical protein
MTVIFLFYLTSISVPQVNKEHIATTTKKGAHQTEKEEENETAFNKYT